MVIIFALLGIIFGSFINAFVWRLRKLEVARSKVDVKYSITKGRSMCVHCGHVLAVKDLVPVLSWISLRGKCRYCNKPISAQYPIVELLTGMLFALSAVHWPYELSSLYGATLLGVWLVSLVLLISLALYDLRWFELPDRVVYPLSLLAIIYAAALGLLDGSFLTTGTAVMSGVIFFGIFWALFQVSDGQWIGGGDVKLAFALGIFASTPLQVFLLIFIASLLGTALSLPALVSQKQAMKLKIPFGPYLIAAVVIVVLYGQAIVDWYQRLVLIT